ncbi:MAG: Ldh family oxidoreductase [Rhodobacteraceae bacterium]|nr:Ldh family oxidoreductase [Paracoccaceae bacterium]PHR55902.1 MAG: lactate dehydrogenase [Robiginitomaculum sp.]
MAPTKKRVDSGELKTFVIDLLSAYDVNIDHAKTMADVFCWANLRGVDSHGVARVARYIELFDKGDANRTPVIVDHALRPALNMIDADFAPGAVAMTRGVDLVVDLAKTQGVGWVQVKNTVHAGAMGYYVERLANAGMVGIVMLAGMPNMAYPGARPAAVATSPFAVGVPAKDSAPFLLDMATATIALGKIKQYKIRGEALPDNAAVTADGVPTTDASLAKMPLPLGGMKGAGMSLAFELLTSVLSGVPVVSPIHAKADGAKRHRQNAVIIAVDPAAFGDTEAFQMAVTETLNSIRGLTPVSPDETIGVPGDRGGAIAKTRANTGIPLPEATLNELASLAEAKGMNTIKTLD